MSQSFSLFPPTIEDTFWKQYNYENESFLLDFVNTAIDGDLHAWRDTYLRICHGYLLCFSLESKKSMEDLREFYYLIHKAKYKPVGTVPIVFVGTKSDLTGERKVSDEEIGIFAKEFSHPFL